MSEWISVKDMLPRESDFVLVADARTNEFAFACLRKDESGEMRWFGLNPDEDMNIYWGFEEFTHWIEVPDAPEEEST